MIRRAPRPAPLVLLLALLLAATARAQESPLAAGPMAGFSAHRQALLWVQTARPAEVRFRWWDLAEPARGDTTAAVATATATAHVAKVVVDGLEPGRRYGYEVLVDGRPAPRDWPLEFQTQALWQWRTDPPPFTLAVASCFYVNEPPVDRPGTPYGGDPRILGAIHALRPDAMVWLGDNTYLREVDWDTREGILRRYSHTRALPELQPLLGSTHHYATWDDHDFGPNNSDRSYWAKHLTREAFDLFWGNPPFGGHGLGGITSRVQWADVEIFLLDDRWDRSPERRRTGERTILGSEQFRWLIDALASSRAPFKLVAIGGQVVSPAAVFENWATYPEARERLLEALAEERIEGVVFLTGDRHHTELTRLERAGAYPLYDLTVSPLTAGVGNPREENAARVDGTLVKAHNFAILSFSGPRLDRRMEIAVRGADGEVLWTRTIAATELAYPDEDEEAGQR